MGSSPVAVASPDPGADGGPKQDSGAAGPAGDSDVTMAEASEEVAAVAEVKDEGAALARDGALTADAVRDAPDAGREEADASAAVDPLYATEAAGMVVAEGCRDGDSINGLGSGSSDNMAGALTGEPEWKPVTAGDVAGGSATSEQAEAESSELGEYHVNATPVAGNEGQDNGVAHFEEEIQNGSANSAQCARYCLPPLDKEGFRVSDLVWGKVKSHPWWPGEIFDPSNASELALKHQKKGSRLVAYFGDNSFAWCDESQLKPFVTDYSQMEKQSSSDSFVGSVNYALEELSRRILSGMSCACLPEELSDSGMSYMVENAGLKDGVTCSTVNRSEILASFSPESLLRYIRSLALFPGQGGDLLELVIACSQLTSFYRSKGCPELASFQTGSAWVEDDTDTSPIEDVMVEEVVVSEVPPPEVKPKRGRGRPRKHKPEDKLELPGKQKPAVAVERQMIKDFDDKKRSLDSFEDLDTKSPTGGSFKIGECIRRAASQLTGPSSIVKSQNENTAEAENAEFDVSSDDAANELTVEKCAKRRRLHSHHLADPKELFSQLCSVAIEPTEGYNFSALTISYFSDFRNYVVSVATEASIIEKSTLKRRRKKRVLPSPELETTDHMQDSYWSGLSLLNHPIHSLKRASTNTRPRHRRKSSHEKDLSSVQDQQVAPKQVAPKKQIQVIERSIIHVDEKIVDEWKPTALVLSFGRSTDLLSETDLIKKFGRYGPLKESETEVQNSTNTIKIAFKKRADAERAFSAAGKFGTLGPSLRSYRLVNMPFSLGESEPNKSEACPGDHGPELPGPSEPKVSLDAVKDNQVDKTEKAEAVQPSSGEQVETVKKTCQAKPVKQSSGAQVETFQQASQPEADAVKKTGKIAAELTVPSDQIATADVTEQTMEIQAPKDAVEIPCDVKLDDEALTEESVDQVASEQVKVPSDAVPDTSKVQLETPVEQEDTAAQDLTEVSVQEAGLKKQIVEPKTAEVELEQVSCLEQTVQVEDVIDASGGHTNVGRKTAEEITMPEVVVEGAAESKAVAPVEETVEDKATAGTLSEAIEGKSTAEAPDDEMENTDAAESLGGEVGVGEATGDSPDERVAVEALAGMSTQGETAAEAADAEITTAGKTAEGVSVRTPSKKATTAKKPVKGATVEAPGKKATTAKKPLEDATVEARDEKGATAKKTAEGATVEAPDEKAMTAEEDAMA